MKTIILPPRAILSMYCSVQATVLARRGMLLLMVLSMLTLFLLMGTLAIVVATRARNSAHAFADATNGARHTPVIARTVLDEALLTLVRGSADPKVRESVTESLLGDMYDDLDDNGRRQRASTTGTAASLYPRPFVDEAYDSYDAPDVSSPANPFLTNIALKTDGRPEAVLRPAFQRSGTNAPLPVEVDNDNDGLLDGVWLDNVFPSLTLPNGSEQKFRVSYLVMDLDGRLNVNTHGRGAGTNDTVAGKSAPASGAADLDPTFRGVIPADTSTLILSGTGGTQPLSSAGPDIQWRRRPTLGSSAQVDGRFGRSANTNTYAIRLDLEAARPALLAQSPTQNPFTLGELERVLRQFDTDANTLPPRLMVVLNDHAERARMRITTDSWDTVGERQNIEWEAANSGTKDEKQIWTEICDAIRRIEPNVPLADLRQWVANIIEFRDVDNGLTNFDGGIRGVEPRNVSPPIPSGPSPWDAGYFLSYAQVLAVPKGTKADWDARRAATPPLPLVSLAQEYPRILEALTVPSLFRPTITADPRREPGRINVNTCDQAAWETLLGRTEQNPFRISAATAAKTVGDVLTRQDLIYLPGTSVPDAERVNHATATRLANVATVRSHVFAIWITVEITTTGATTEDRSAHRLFAIVDRSIPVEYVEGQDRNVRDMIRLRRFLD